MWMFELFHSKKQLNPKYKNSELWNLYKKKILILDLDQTLIYSSYWHFPGSEEIRIANKTVYISKRPYADLFL